MKYVILLIAIIFGSVAVADDLDKLRNNVIVSDCILASSYSEDEILEMDWPTLLYIKQQCKKDNELAKELFPIENES